VVGYSEHSNQFEASIREINSFASCVSSQLAPHSMKIFGHSGRNNYDIF